MRVLLSIFSMLCLVGHVVLRGASVALVLPWLLRLLKIPSLFDRWLPGLSHWQLLACAVGADVGSIVLLRLSTTKEKLEALIEE